MHNRAYYYASIVVHLRSVGRVQIVFVRELPWAPMARELTQKLAVVHVQAHGTYLLQVGWIPMP